MALTMLGRAFKKEELASANTTFTLFWSPPLAVAAMWLWDPHGIITVSVVAGVLLVMLRAKAVRAAWVARLSAGARAFARARS